MPIPRTPGAPYFDEHGVRTFLNLILQHGSNAGISDPDALVTFIVRYSSDRVREVIRYIPELDDDEPNRTWKAAQEQMLLLYGSSDEERRVSERELIEFCRDQSAKSPYRSKAEIEQYLRSFQLLAAPLLKQRDITIAQRDFYFVSGIRTQIKNWFIERVPEPQRTRSNPISLTDSLGILYGYLIPMHYFLTFGPISIYPRACRPILRPTAPPTPYTSSFPSFQATYTPLLPDIRIPTTSALTALEHDAKSSAPPTTESISSPTLSASSFSSPTSLSQLNSKKLTQIALRSRSTWDLIVHEDFKVSPSDEITDSLGDFEAKTEESPYISVDSMRSLTGFLSCTVFLNCIAFWIKSTPSSSRYGNAQS
ncbi:hypothetical protein B0H13DRAFT_1914781 [Mycena leptocephala]|nr:hypothetical protein B0H13DRAFT_1914781 [Mycena leptocephala]